MTISRDERNRLRKLASRATPGPWVASADYDLSGRQVSDESILIGTPRGLPDDVGSTAQGADAEFIAAARTAVPALLDALDNAEQQIKAVRDVHYPVQGIHGPLVCAHRSCVDDAMDQCEWPCATIRAIEGDA